ncbi:RbsD/FucU domain-containing protein [Oceanithermus sp.]
MQPIDRFEYYDRAQDAYAIVATSETKLYACIILKKGVIFPD